MATQAKSILDLRVTRLVPMEMVPISSLVNPLPQKWYFFYHDFFKKKKKKISNQIDLLPKILLSFFNAFVFNVQCFISTSLFLTYALSLYVNKCNFYNLCITLIGPLLLHLFFLFQNENIEI